MAAAVVQQRCLACVARFLLWLSASRPVRWAKACGSGTQRVLGACGRAVGRGAHACWARLVASMLPLLLAVRDRMVSCGAGVARGGRYIAHGIQGWAVWPACGRAARAVNDAVCAVLRWAAQQVRWGCIAARESRLAAAAWAGCGRAGGGARSVSRWVGGGFERGVRGVADSRLSDQCSRCARACGRAAEWCWRHTATPACAALRRCGAFVSTSVTACGSSLAACRVRVAEWSLPARRCSAACGRATQGAIGPPCSAVGRVLWRGVCAVGRVVWRGVCAVGRGVRTVVTIPVWGPPVVTRAAYWVLSAGWRPTPIAELRARLLSTVSAALIAEPAMFWEANGPVTTICEAVDECVARGEGEWVLKVAVFARRRLRLRTATAVLLGAAFKHGAACAPPLVLQRYALAAWLTPSDVCETVGMLHQLRRLEAAREAGAEVEVPSLEVAPKWRVPAAMRRAVAARFLRFNDAQLSRHGRARTQTRRNRRARQRLADRGAVAHTKPPAPTMKQLIRACHISEPAMLVHQVLEKRYPATELEFEASSLARAVAGAAAPAWSVDLAGARLRLPTPTTWEARLSAAGGARSKVTWETAVANGELSYLAALRNLRNLVVADVSAATHAAVADMLRDPEAVARAGALPFQYLAAWANVRQMCEDGAVAAAVEAAAATEDAAARGARDDTKAGKGAAAASNAEIEAAMAVEAAAAEAERAEAAAAAVENYRAAITDALHQRLQAACGGSFAGRTVVAIDCRFPMNQLHSRYPSRQSRRGLACQIAALLRDACDDEVTFVLWGNGRERDFETIEADDVLRRAAAVGSAEAIEALGGAGAAEEDAGPEELPALACAQALAALGEACRHDRAAPFVLYPLMEQWLAAEEPPVVQRLVIISYATLRAHDLADNVLYPAQYRGLAKQLRGATMAGLVARYRAAVNPDFELVGIDIAGSAAAANDVLLSAAARGSDDTREVQVTGFSDALFSVIGVHLERDQEGAVDAVAAAALGEPVGVDGVHVEVGAGGGGGGGDEGRGPAEGDGGREAGGAAAAAGGGAAGGEA